MNEKVKPQDLVRNLVTALDRRDLDAALATVSPKFRMYWVGEPDLVRNRKEYRTHWESYYADHPDTRVKLVNVIEGTESVAAELSVSYLPKTRGSGPHGGATGQRKRVEGRFAVFGELDSKGLIAVARLENGRIGSE